MPLVADRLADLAVQALDRVGRVDDLADLRREREERNHLLPLAAPAGDDRWVLLAPGAFLEHAKGGRGGLGAGRRVDRLQILRDCFALLPGRELHRVADQVDDAGLDDGIRKHGRDRLRKALEAIDNGDQDVRRAAAADLRHHAHPELGALGLLDPEPEDLLGAGAVHADGQVDGLVADQALVADLHPQGIEVDDRVGRLERPVLPGHGLIHDRLGDRRDQTRETVMP